MEASSKEILIQYEELYLDSGDGLLLDLGLTPINNEITSGYNINPKLLNPNGETKPCYNIPACYRLYCPNDLEHLNSKHLFNTAKSLYFLVSRNREQIRAYKIKTFIINLMNIKLFFEIPFKPRVITKYNWCGFYIEN